MIDVTRRGGIQEESMDVDTRPCLIRMKGNSRTLSFRTVWR
jgi:hypothetical protein